MVCIQKAVDLLLDVAHLRITEATAVRNPLDCRRDILKTVQKLFFCAHFIAISPAAIFVIKCNAAVFACRSIRDLEMKKEDRRETPEKFKILRSELR